VPEIDSISKSGETGAHRRARSRNSGIRASFERLYYIDIREKLSLYLHARNDIVYCSFSLVNGIRICRIAHHAVRLMETRWK